MASLAPGPEDDETEEQRDGCHGEHEDLRPDACFFCPWSEVVTRCQSLGRIEDGKCSAHQGQDDQRAAEIGTSEHDLG